jgi:hypothetical protein
MINAQKGKLKIYLVSDNHANKLINSSKKYVLLFLRETRLGKESIRVKVSLEGCNK